MLSLSKFLSKVNFSDISGAYSMYEEIKEESCVPFKFEGEINAGVLLIHGFTGSPGEIKPLGEYLAKKGFHVRAVLLPGHCTSPEDLEKTTWEDWAKKVREEYHAFSSELNAPVFVSGLSLGGALTLYLAEVEKDIPAIAPLAAPVKLPAIVKLAPLILKFERFIKARPKVKYEIKHYFYDKIPVKSVIEVVKIVNFVRENLKKIISPTLIVQGLKDETISPDNARIIYNNISSEIKEILWLKNTHHVIPLDVERERAFEAIANFFMRFI